VEEEQNIKDQQKGGYKAQGRGFEQKVQKLTFSTCRTEQKVEHRVGAGR